MAKRPAPPPVLRPANLSIEAMKNAIPRLERRIADLEKFDPSTLQSRSTPETATLQTSIEETLQRVFGAETIEYNRYRPAAVLNAGPISMTFGRGPDMAFRQYLAESRDRSIALLRQAIDGMKEEMEHRGLQGIAADESQHEAARIFHPRRIFIVHGRDDGPREAVARFVEKIGYEPIILHEQPNKGRTLLSKFSQEATDTGFAIVLMTADDLGGPKDQQTNPRARQNVVFELGFFIGALGPDRVAALLEEGVELPSDFEGVVYIPLDANWKTKLAKELEAANYEIDWNIVMKQ